MRFTRVEKKDSGGGCFNFSFPLRASRKGNNNGRILTWKKKKKKERNRKRPISFFLRKARFGTSILRDFSRKRLTKPSQLGGKKKKGGGGERGKSCPSPGGAGCRV